MGCRSRIRCGPLLKSPVSWQFFSLALLSVPSPTPTLSCSPPAALGPQHVTLGGGASRSVLHPVPVMSRCWRHTQRGGAVCLVMLLGEGTCKQYGVVSSGGVLGSSNCILKKALRRGRRGRYPTGSTAEPRAQGTYQPHLTFLRVRECI